MNLSDREQRPSVGYWGWDDLEQHWVNLLREPPCTCPQVLLWGHWLNCPSYGQNTP